MNLHGVFSCCFLVLVDACKRYTPDFGCGSMLHPKETRVFLQLAAATTTQQIIHFID